MKVEKKFTLYTNHGYLSFFFIEYPSISVFVVRFYRNDFYDCISSLNILYIFLRHNEHAHNDRCEGNHTEESVCSKPEAKSIQLHGIKAIALGSGEHEDTKEKRR